MYFLTNNTHINVTSCPSWIVLNDSIVIIGNFVTILITLNFILTRIHTEPSPYSISNKLACNICLAVGLTSITMLIIAIYGLVSCIRGMTYCESFCMKCRPLLHLFYIYIHISFCLKALYRLRRIICCTNPLTQPRRTLFLMILTQSLLIIVLFLGLLLTNDINYDCKRDLSFALFGKIHQLWYMSMYNDTSMYLSIYLSIYRYINIHQRFQSVASGQEKSIYEIDSVHLV